MLFPKYSHIQLKTLFYHDEKTFFLKSKAKKEEKKYRKKVSFLISAHQSSRKNVCITYGL